MADIKIQLGGNRYKSKPIRGYAIVSPSKSSLAQLDWCINANGYALRWSRTGNTKIFMHREIMEENLGRPLLMGELVDHINHDRLDNRDENLRVATNSQNMQNRSGLGSNNTSGFRGVTFHPLAEKWVARIKVNGKSRHIGLFATAAEAGAAAAKARQEAGFLTKETK